MSNCIKCGKEIEKDAAFCVGCGAPVEKETATDPEQNAILTVPSQFHPCNEELNKEECDFLNNTHNLLRWEQKAWNIASKIWIILGIIYAAVFSLYIIIGAAMAIDDFPLGVIFIGLGIFASLFGGGSFIGIGIVSKKAAEKLPQYIDTAYTDFSISYKRCKSVGMLVFSILFGVVSTIFFIINFVRMKTNRVVIERILKNQNV